MCKPSLIIGLGNPGSRFHLTRHNIGFMVVDALAEYYGVRWKSGKQGETASFSLHNQEIILLKPQTFMNSSGEALAGVRNAYHKAHDILVIHDELEKPFGSMQLRFAGSARGHNGLRSLMEKVGSDFWRLRMGIGRPIEKSQVATYVLTRFTPEEQAGLGEWLAQAREKVASFYSADEK